MKDSFCDSRHEDLRMAQQLAYAPARLVCKNFHLEHESSDYGASEFELNNFRIKFRIAKKTPKKSGSFVTLWKRTWQGPIVPCCLNDPIDFYVVSVRNGNDLGQFIFPKSILSHRGILASESQEGKRAFRIYAPWDQTPNQQAEKTKEWQSPFFIAIDKHVDLFAFRRLFSLTSHSH